MQLNNKLQVSLENCPKNHNQSPARGPWRPRAGGAGRQCGWNEWPSVVVVRRQRRVGTHHVRAGGGRGEAEHGGVVLLLLAAVLT